MKFLPVTLFLLTTAVHGFNVPQSNTPLDRRNLLDTFVAAASTVGVIGIAAATVAPAPALASGGATAGRYTTIPIAKRRYYGRVQQAVHEFLIMGPAIVKGDILAVDVQHFFDLQGTVIVPAKRKDVNGVCTKKDGDCKGKEIKDSRWNDMKASMYLLGNAFRINQQKAPDNLPTVKAAKAFFKQVDALEKLATAKSQKQGDSTKAQQIYLNALDILDTYLDLVELPPSESGNYEQEFDTRVGISSRIT
jgi:hypothetical protein